MTKTVVNIQWKVVCLQIKIRDLADLNYHVYVQSVSLTKIELVQMKKIIVNIY